MDNLKKDVDELIDIIKNTDVYKRYIHITEQMNGSNDINELVAEIKSLQKVAVKEEHKPDSKKVRELDKEINNKIKELNNIPLYAEYIETSKELDDLIKSIKEEIQTYIDKLKI
jgi:cell fate (sporulation/competence/biofilm development) regulator YmcA (YheA/YmcA/DUF963 family)